MAFQRLSFMKPGTGGGGFYGDGRICTWQNWRAAEHSLVKHGPDGRTVVEEYPPQLYLGIDIYAERTDLDDDTFPVCVTQWYGIGQLPLSRLEELGWPMGRLNASIVKGPGGNKQWEQRVKNPGGFRAMDAAGNLVAEGAFFGSETESGPYKGSGYWQFWEEILNLASADGEVLDDRMEAHGFPCLSGLVAKGGTKDLPKSKSALKEEQLKGEVKDARKIVVPVEIVKWPWQTASAAPVSAPAATKKPSTSKPAAAPAPAPAPAPVAAPAAAPAAAGEPTDQDYEIASVVTQVLEKHGPLVKGAAGLGQKMMPLLSGNKKMAAFMQTANTEAFLSNETFNGNIWQYDPATGLVSPIKPE